MKDEVDIKWELLGAKFANLGDKEQSLFFKGMGRELAHWDSDHQKQMQFFAVSDSLTDKEKAQLKIALECIWWEE